MEQATDESHMAQLGILCLDAVFLPGAGTCLGGMRIDDIRHDPERFIHGMIVIAVRGEMHVYGRVGGCGEIIFSGRRSCRLCCIASIYRCENVIRVIFLSIEKNCILFNHSFYDKVRLYFHTKGRLSIDLDWEAWTVQRRRGTPEGHERHLCD
ncbi:MAG: hypothetical protein JXQ27_03195 [Acidobacteria bacterium]|nr:hypothetical protein [Acidobacteriota bacterium]